VNNPTGKSNVRDKLKVRGSPMSKVLISVNEEKKRNHNYGANTLRLQN